MLRVLIVDDDKTVRTLLGDYLRERGYEVAMDEGGSLALAHLPVFRPDLVLLDILMPGMDGIEVLRQIKQGNPDVCVIMLTAVADLKIARNAMAQGADDYLTKPFKFEQLETCLTVHGLLHTGV